TSNPDRRRFTKKKHQASNHYMYAQWSIFSLQPLKKIIPGIFLFAATVAAGQEHTTFILSDAQGSPAVGLDVSGTVVWRGDYDPFGQLIGQSGSMLTNLQWLGVPYDSESGLLSMGSRQYHPGLSRFLSVDPALIGVLPPVSLASPARLNAYAYG